MAVTKANVIRIGNSWGVRIPKALLEQCRLGDTVELDVGNGRLVIRSVDRPRRGWHEAFRKMSERGDDDLLDTDASPAHWDDIEWQR